MKLGCPDIVEGNCVSRWLIGQPSAVLVALIARVMYLLEETVTKGRKNIV